MSKTKSPGLVVNKAAEIRQVASLLASQGKLPRPKEIRDQLGRKGIVVTSQQVSMALANTEFAYRRNRTNLEKMPLPPNLGEMPLDDLSKAQDFVRKIGSLKRAAAALAAFGLFKQEPDPEPEQYYGGA